LEKFFGGTRKKEIVKSILLGGERQRAAAGWSIKVRSLDFRQKKFGFRPTSTTTQETPILPTRLVFPVWWRVYQKVRATTRSARASFGVLLEMSPNFLV